MNIPKDKGPHVVDMNAGAVLFACRCWRRLSQKELGAAVGISYQQIQKYEMARSRMSISTLFRISQVLEVPVTMFFVALDGSVPDEEHLRLMETAVEVPVAD